MGDLPGQGAGGDFGSEDGKPSIPMSRGAKRTEELRQLRAALEARNTTIASLSSRYARAIEALRGCVDSADALRDLLVCYRTGRSPVTKLFDRLELVEGNLAAARAVIAEEEQP
jgi:hypothetical protein